MLEPDEWAQIEAIDDAYFRTIHTSKERVRGKAIWWVERITKFRELSGDPSAGSDGQCSIDKHRTEAVGPPCEECRRPLRSPEATMCAACGAKRRGT